jgi:glycosyltransferase involved in cell wall biosynthesis
MKISIITVCYNSEKYIQTAIDSVLQQTYEDIEYIIVDGGSIDATLSIIKPYQHKISKFISEPDNGIYDAMNKGINLATGDIIGTLNSDDLYVDEQVLSQVNEIFQNSKSDSLFADLFYVDKEDTNKIIRKWKTKEFIPGSFKKGWHPPHPTFFVKRDVYNKYGLFDLRYKLAADFELMLRFLEKNKIKSVYLNQPLVKMRLGGATNKNLKNILHQNIECYKAFKKNELDVSIFYPFYRLLPKFAQFLK